MEEEDLWARSKGPAGTLLGVEKGVPGGEKLEVLPSGMNEWFLSPNCPCLGTEEPVGLPFLVWLHICLSPSEK